MTPDAFAAVVIAGMASDRAVVAPGRARSISGLVRFAPRLASRAIAGNLRKELRHSD